MKVEKHNIAEMICEKLLFIKESLCKVPTLILPTFETSLMCYTLHF